MPFINTYEGAMRQLASIGKGTCKGDCKKVWIRNITYALKTKTNPLSLNATQRKNVKERMKVVSGKSGINNYSKTLKKYKSRNSPPYPANQNCNKEMVGNDGNKYISIPNKNGVCSWKKIR